MNSKSLFLLVVVASLTFPLLETLADPVTFDLLANIDYPEGTETFASGINDRGDVTGYVNYNQRPPRGYVLFANGSFSPPISNPDAYLGIVYPAGINNARTLCGNYTGTDIGDHGFVYSHGTFTDVVVGGIDTWVKKINDAGNFCGYTGNPAQGFVSIEGVVTVFTVPGAGVTYAEGINNLNEVVGGYGDSVGSFHGFRRAPDGTLRYPIDGPLAEDTFLFAINDKGQMTGSVIVDNGSEVHAIFLPSPSQFAVYDLPDATIYTDFEGINNKGQICGRYFDGRRNHGFVVKVRPATGE